MSEVRNTINYLRACQGARAADYPVRYVTDPRWLVNMAVNRRAGWPDDPSLTRGSAMPVHGRYPKRAEGDEFRTLEHLARKVNTPRLIVRDRECPVRYRARLRHRFFMEE